MKLILSVLVMTMAVAAGAAGLSVVSPDGKLTLDFENDAQGMRWALKRGETTLVAPSALGLRFAAYTAATKTEFGPMRIVNERKTKGAYNELEVTLEEIEPGMPKVGLGQTEAVMVPRRLQLIFRAYDEGVAFRYVVPEQQAFDGFELIDELTEWKFVGDPEVWTTEYPAETGSQEVAFLHKQLSAIESKVYVGMPVLVRTAGSTLALTEAALVNWAGMFYRADGKGGLRAGLTKLPPSSASTRDAAVIRQTPAASPWRVVMVGADELDLLKKKGLIYELNPDPDPTIDFSFVKPGASTWDWWVESNNSLSTEQTLKLVDFAAEMGWPYHTIDGGWYGFARRPNHGPEVPLEPRKGFELERIVAHAKAKGVGIWVWIHWQEIEDVGIEETFARLEKWGIVGVKTDFLDRQDQWMVNWYERVARIAARHRIMVNFHGAFKPTGTERTWPNNLTREGILGNEMQLFNRRITPVHSLTLPFTRYLLGPGDFTPGGFANVYSRDFVPQKEKGHRYGDETDRCPHWAEQVGTRGFALAQCVAYDSPLMTMCDWPERYRGAAGIEALRKLPTAWKKTLPLSGRIGEHYVVARQTQDGRWYVAAMTVGARMVDLPLTFLDDGVWTVSVYADDPVKTPTDAKALMQATHILKSSDNLTLNLCAEGGALVILERR